MNENQTNLQANNENPEMGVPNQSLQQSQSTGQNQSIQQNQGNQASVERTIVNGKVVPLSEAQAMEEQFNKQNTSTGIQQHHDNSSEAVQAGQVAQNSPQQQEPTFKQANVQSGQSHLSQNGGQGQSQAQLQKQEDHQTIQNSVDQKAKAKAKTKKEQ